jgi:GT2 family glycosyltransferase
MLSVDVVIPCYNYARYLQQCVESVLSQQGVETRVLIVDDASSDDTPEIGARIARQLDNLEFLRHQVNEGHIATYNQGLLEWAKSQYSVLLSADDALAPGALWRACSLMEQNSEMGMAYGLGLEFFGEERLPDPPDPPVEESTVIPAQRFLEAICIDGNFVPTPAVVVRTDWQKRIGGYTASLPHSGDMEMWLRFALEGPVGFVPAVQAYKRSHATNMTFIHSSDMLGDLREQYDACRQAFQPYLKRRPELGGLLERTSRRIAEQALWCACGAFDSGVIDEVGALIDCAEEVSPGLAQTRKWRRLRIRQRLGPTLWGLLQRFRGNAPGDGRLPQPAETGNARLIGSRPSQGIKDAVVF